MQNRQRPEPSDYGLPANFKQTADIASKDIPDVTRNQYIISGSLAFLIWYRYNDDNWNGIIAVISLFYVFFPIFLIGTMVLSATIDKLKQTFDSVIEPSEKKAERKKIEQYLQDLASWNYWNIDTGEGFWRSLRGVEFEEALYRLFSARGVKVSATPASNDGGVDIVLIISGQEYWIQAKGLDAKVGVNPIREIAGVCSNKDVIPVVAAVNDFTKPAMKTASYLNVYLIDSPQLSRMAEETSLSSIFFKGARPYPSP